MNRRTVSGLLVVSGTALVASAVGIPGIIAAISPAWLPRRETWRPVGELSKFPTSKVSQATVLPDRDVWPRTFGELVVFVWRQSDSDFVVFSRRCTDLGCPLDHEPGSGCYLCPCHGGIFAPDGQPLAGPSNTPMHRYTHRIRAEVLEIDIASIPLAA